MKRLFILFLSVLLLTTSLLPVTSYAEVPTIKAESYIMVDAVTGKVLLEEQADLALPPASMTKLMTLYLVRRQIEQKKLSWNKKVQPSQKVLKLAGTPGLARVPLSNRTYTVRELYDAAFIKSANDAAVLLAEVVAGIEQKFVKLMNETANTFGMDNTEYSNASGLDAVDAALPGTNLMTATDIALLVIRFIKDYPDVLDVTSRSSMKLDGITLQNSDKMLKDQKYAYPGMRGMKTGTTDLAGYCFAGVATKDNMTIITVVMRTTSDQARFAETKKLLDYGFSSFEPLTYYGKGERIKDVFPIRGAEETDYDVITDASLYVTVPKNAATRPPVFTFNLTHAPIKNGASVGTVQVKDEGMYLPGFDVPRSLLYSAERIALASFKTRLFRAIAAWSDKIDDAIRKPGLVNLKQDSVK
ncbi:D-alanyl-D-alanine carboxypeptidase (plasmid) [Exiguobacterium sp. N4-1P]|uniref:D-alanyl-D-alanine carboxypeptidase family protein n=1 Tax=Exiguobacterium sp. N4-1P TaxID=2051906 RepID=UPI000B5878CE|nr:D-alanyl-D-alanine carboxypeptidase family protein [Exiguobacterium sp. N4-1P]ASI34049.1 D-alanyl-D-alanine carboxypeptidase [Exiguobacterium sp. N4-1P]ASI37041.1 D-alanyl-D-alanine carboxypeptidase [Exiguobacterium sp. N4-1P]